MLEFERCRDFTTVLEGLRRASGVLPGARILHETTITLRFIYDLALSLYTRDPASCPDIHSMF